MTLLGLKYFDVIFSDGRRSIFKGQATHCDLWGILPKETGNYIFQSLDSLGKFERFMELPLESFYPVQLHKIVSNRTELTIGDWVALPRHPRPLAEVYRATAGYRLYVDILVKSPIKAFQLELKYKLGAFFPYQQAIFPRGGIEIIDDNLKAPPLMFLLQQAGCYSYHKTFNLYKTKGMEMEAKKNHQPTPLYASFYDYLGKNSPGISKSGYQKIFKRCVDYLFQKACYHPEEFNLNSSERGEFLAELSDIAFHLPRMKRLQVKPVMDIAIYRDRGSEGELDVCPIR